MKHKQEIYVSDGSPEDCAKSAAYTYTYLDTLSEGRTACKWVADGKEGVDLYEYAIPAPQLKTIPFTGATVPKGLLMIQGKGWKEGSYELVCSHLQHGLGVKHNNCIPWQDLHDNYLLSTDGGATWGVFGLEVEE